jgi:potassium/chloride transporter 9
LQEELKNISFNDLPAKGQHLVLNEIMRRHSPKDSTDIIFSTLPAPTLGAHLDEEDAFEYTNSLAVWLDGLSPIFLLNSQSVTVTTAL